MPGTRSNSQHFADSDDRASIGASLRLAIQNNGTLDPRSGKLVGLQYKDLAARAGINAGRIGQLINGQRSPTLSEAMRIAIVLGLSPEELVDRDSPNCLMLRDGVAWRVAGVPPGSEERACRFAALGALEGAPLDDVRESIEIVLRAGGRELLPIHDSRVPEMVSRGLGLGLVRLESAPVDADAEDGEALGRSGEDVRLAARLADALGRDTASKQVPVVRVVRNLAHPSFGGDPISPCLVARVAHRILADHFDRYKTIYEIGLAGGMHCLTFVRMTGGESSPFPEDSGDKQICFVPLTLEPFGNHELPMADSVVGRMVINAGDVLGHKRVTAASFHSASYVEDQKVKGQSNVAIELVRQHYRDLDVAIFGCGDLEKDGWLERVMRRVDIEPGRDPATDVCLNLLDAQGEPVSLADGRAFIGISLPDLRRLVQSPERMAMLLTSGAAKGRPIVAASRAGCVDTIVCDQAAARAALEALEEPRVAG